MKRRSMLSVLTLGLGLAVVSSNLGGCPQDSSLSELISQIAEQTPNGGTSGTQSDGNDVKLPKPNIPPSASAGDDITVSAGQTVFLDGSKSTDADGDNLRIMWSQIDGSPVVDLESPFASVASFDAPVDIKAATTLKFRITVIDGHVATTDDVTVIITP